MLVGIVVDVGLVVARPVEGLVLAGRAGSGAVGEVVLDGPQERVGGTDHLRCEAVLRKAEEAAQLGDQQPQ